MIIDELPHGSESCSKVNLMSLALTSSIISFNKSFHKGNPAYFPTPAPKTKVFLPLLKSA